MARRHCGSRITARVQVSVWLGDPYPAPAHGLAAQLEATRAYDTLDRLPQISAPTLVLVGDQDILTPVAAARELAEGIPGARLQVLAGGGHLALVECEQAFTDALLAFLINRRRRPIEHGLRREAGRVCGT